jgi:hypothetical protein
MAMFRVRTVCLSGAMLMSIGQMARAQEPQAPVAPAPADATTAQTANDPQAPKDAQAVAVDPDLVLPPCPVAAPTAAPAAATPDAGTNPPAATGTPAVTTVTTTAVGTGSAGVAIMADGTPCKKPPVIRYDKKGKPIKEKVKKEKPPKLVPVTIVKGALTVDGLIAKADLNFQILDLQYFYIWVPGMGTAIVSNHPFTGSKLETDALAGSVLTIKVDDHQLQLAADRDMLGGKKPKPLTLYVGIDRTYQRGSVYPEFGYGSTRKAPYNWPGTLADVAPNPKAPPLPDNLKQKTQSVKMCAKNPDGTEGACRTVEVPMAQGKKGS